MQTFAPERDVVSWDDLDSLVAGLADRLADTRFDLLLAITRGGLVPAGMLAYRLGIRNILVAAVEFYDDAARPGPPPTRRPSSFQPTRCCGASGSLSWTRSGTAGRPSMPSRSGSARPVA